MLSQTHFSGRYRFYNLEKALANPEQVKVLNLNNPAFTELPSSISNLINLVELDLSKSNITAFKTKIKLPELRVLNLEGIDGLQLQELLIAINSSRKLEEIYLSNCQLNYIPHQIGNFPNLKVIDVSNNNIRNLPYEIESLGNMEKADLSNNKLVKLNNKLINWSKLKDLNIANNDSLKQKDVFLTISYLSQLETLTIGGLKMLTSDVSELQNVKHLKIIESNFTSLPNDLIYLKKLEQLSFVSTNLNGLLNLFSGNNIISLNIDNGTFKGIAQITSLKELSISNSKIPSTFYEIEQLEKLATINLKNCSNFNLDELIIQLNNTTSIHNISIIACGIEEIPVGIANLKGLQQLDFTRNNIKTIPSEIAILKNLKVLNIKNNVINPNEVENLQKSNNQLAIYWDFYDDFIVDADIPISKEKTKEIIPPLKGIDVPKKDFKIDAQEETPMSFESGTSLKIPKNAFVDIDGNIVEGEVDVTFREFIAPEDFLVSGIPMSYDSAGISYNFSSAGQIEFKASQNGTEVFPNPNNLIEVNMVSANNDPAMNMYVFNEDIGNWEIMSPNKIIDPNDSKLLSDLMDSTTLYKSLPSSLYQPPPVYYDLIKFNVKKDNKLKSFQLTFNKLPVLYDSKDARKSFAQLRTINKYTWIYDGKDVKNELFKMDSLADFLNKSYKRYKVKKLLSSNAKYYNKDCPTFVKNIKIEPNAEDDNYSLTLLMFDDTLTLPVYPKITTTYPELEQRRNKQLYKAYNNSLKRNARNWQRADKKYGKLLAQYESNYNTVNRYTEQNRKSLESQALVYRSFNLMSFGVYNCDQIRRMQQPKRLLAKLLDEDDKVIDPFTVYVIDKSTTSVMTFNTQKQAYYDAGSKNAILLVLKDDKIGLIDVATFSKAMKNGDKDIKVKIFSNKDISLGQLKSYL